jgi:hypothetical protein
VHALVQRLVSVAKMATVLEKCKTEEQRFVVRYFLWARGLNVKDVHIEIFRFYGEKCLLVKRFTTGCKHFADERK